jgi:DnaJ-class molecular chaperone
MEYKDYYKILGLNKNASAEEVKKAFRTLARKHHPDVNPHDKAATERFKNINEAYQVLNDPEKRAKYDRLGADWERLSAEEDVFRQYAQAGPRPGTTTGGDYRTFRFGGEDLGGFSDFFETFFGGMGGFTDTSDLFRRTRRPQRGEDFEHPVEITLQEAAFGAKRLLSLSLQEVCPACHGEGMTPSGSGRADRRRRTLEVGRCPECVGGGLTSRRQQIEVSVPAGVVEGSRVRVAGKGGPGASGGPAGDLYLLIKLLPHPLFTVTGHDLHCDVPVTPWEAGLGATIEVPSLKGGLTMTIPSQTRDGRLFRLKGQGMPGLKGSQRGDIFVRVRIALPSRMGSQDQRLLEEWRRLHPQENPRRGLF